MSVETPNPTEGTDLQNTPWQIERAIVDGVVSE